jgi:hypothetical protein
MLSSHVNILVTNLGVCTISAFSLSDLALATGRLAPHRNSYRTSYIRVTIGLFRRWKSTLNSSIIEDTANKLFPVTRVLVMHP